MSASACNCGLRSCIKSDIGPCPVHGRPAYKARAEAPRCHCADQKALKVDLGPCPIHGAPARAARIDRDALAAVIRRKRLAGRLATAR